MSEPFQLPDGGPPQPSPVEHIAAAAGRSSNHLALQLETQAAQLAEALQVQHDDLLHREERLQGRLSQWEHELKKSQQWVLERAEQLKNREQQLQQRLGDVQRQVAALAEAERVALNDWKKWRSDIQQRRKELDLREQSLNRRQAQLEREQEEFRRQQQQNSQHRLSSRNEAELLQKQLEKHRQALEEKEQQLQHREAEMMERMELLDEDRARVRHQREQLAKGLLGKRMHDDALRRESEFSQRTQKMEKLRRDIAHLHGESLEMHSLSKRLWSRMLDRNEQEAENSNDEELSEQLSRRHRQAEESLAQQAEKTRELAEKVRLRRQRLEAQEPR